MPMGSTETPTAKGKRPPRSEGRPKLDAPAAKLSEDRRSQIRRAQKAYRLKKEASLQECQQRVVHLEQNIKMIEDSLQNYKAMLRSQVHKDQANLLSEFDCILNLVASVPNVSEKFLLDQASPRRIEQSSEKSFNKIHYEDTVSKNSTIGEQPSCQSLDRFIGPNVSYTYSFLESTFTRRLKRSSLEHAFSVFSDPHSNPHDVFRLFRLVPCFREKDKMFPFFKNLVTSGRDHPLEISTLPFYTIGGAGTHYPDTNEAGDPVYPSKMRMPRRIIGILPITNGPSDEDSFDQQQRTHLELCGFGGDWFDCRDVEGYLRAKGVNLDESAGFPTTNTSQPFRGALNIDSFLKRLHSGMAILGRAPGFRRSEVELAFQSAFQTLD